MRVALCGWPSLCFFVMVLLLEKYRGPFGYLASLLIGYPLIWIGLILLSGLSWMWTSKGRIGLKEMYESDRFVSIMWRMQLGFVVFCIAALRLLRLMLLWLS